MSSVLGYLIRILESTRKRVADQFDVGSREIPRPAGKSAGLRNDALQNKLGRLTLSGAYRILSVSSRRFGLRECHSAPIKSLSTAGSAD